MARTDLEKSASPTGSNASVTVGSLNETTELTQLGYRPELRRNRSMYTLLFQSLAIAVSYRALHEIN